MDTIAGVDHLNRERSVAIGIIAATDGHFAQLLGKGRKALIFTVK